MPNTPRPPSDGWLGTPELPGYRAGNVVVRLDDLPRVDPDHFYCDLLLLDADGHMQDNRSGPCFALTHERTPDERSRFVRVVAELVRHAADDAQGLAVIHLPLAILRDRGIDTAGLILAAQLLDNVCGEAVVVASLTQQLELSLGADEAPLVLRDVVGSLSARPRSSATWGRPARHRWVQGASADDDVEHIKQAGLDEQVTYIVRAVGKAHARRFLREAMPFDLVPLPEMLGV
jgi:hypothetical protein